MAALRARRIGGQAIYRIMAWKRQLERCARERSHATSKNACAAPRNTGASYLRTPCALAGSLVRASIGGIRPLTPGRADQIPAQAAHAEDHGLAVRQGTFAISSLLSTLGAIKLGGDALDKELRPKDRAITATILLPQKPSRSRPQAKEWKNWVAGKARVMFLGVHSWFSHPQRPHLHPPHQ
jgi:hypothetical protein